jgi:hypothetical protein
MPEAGRLAEAGRLHQLVCIQQASIVPNSIAQLAISPIGAQWGGLAGKRLTVALFATARHFELWRAVAISRRLLNK